MNLKSILIVAILAMSYVSCEKVSFEGYKMLRVIPTTQKQIELINELQHNPDVKLLYT